MAAAGAAAAAAAAGGEGGMVAVVRGMPDATLAVTLLDGTRLYTLQPTSDRKECHHNGTSTKRTMAEASTEIAATGRNDYMRRDSITQASDDRYASSYQVSHCYKTPTSPPVVLTEFPPQKADPLRGSVCTPRSYRDTDQFAKSLRKYPSVSPERSTDMVERLITYTQSKNRHPMSKSSLRSRSSPVRSKEPSLSAVLEELRSVTHQGTASKNEQTYTRRQSAPAQGGPTRDGGSDALRQAAVDALTYDYLGGGRTGARSCRDLDKMDAGAARKSYGKYMDVRYLCDITKSIRERIKQIYEEPSCDAGLPTCPRIRERLNEHLRQCHGGGVEHENNYYNSDCQGYTREVATSCPRVPRKPATGASTCCSSSNAKETATLPQASVRSREYGERPSPPYDSIGNIKYQGCCFSPYRRNHVKLRSKSEEYILQIQSHLRSEFQAWVEEMSFAQYESYDETLQREQVLRKLENSLVEMSQEMDGIDLEQNMRSQVESTLKELLLYYCEYDRDQEVLIEDMTDNLIARITRNNNDRRFGNNSTVIQRSSIRGKTNDQFKTAIKKWIKDIPLKPQSCGVDVDVNEIVDEVDARLRPVAMKRPHCNSMYRATLIDNAVYMLRNMPIRDRCCNSEDQLKQLAQRLVDKLVTVKLQNQQSIQTKCCGNKIKNTTADSNENSRLEEVNRILESHQLNVSSSERSKIASAITSVLDSSMVKNEDNAKIEIMNAMKDIPNMSSADVNFTADNIMKTVNETSLIEELSSEKALQEGSRVEPKPELVKLVSDALQQSNVDSSADERDSYASDISSAFVVSVMRNADDTRNEINSILNNVPDLSSDQANDIVNDIMQRANFSMSIMEESQQSAGRSRMHASTPNLDHAPRRSSLGANNISGIAKNGIDDSALKEDIEKTVEDWMAEVAIQPPERRKTVRELTDIIADIEKNTSVNSAQHDVDVKDKVTRYMKRLPSKTKKMSINSCVEKLLPRLKNIQQDIRSNANESADDNLLPDQISYWLYELPLNIDASDNIDGLKQDLISRIQRSRGDNDNLKKEIINWLGELSVDSEFHKHKPEMAGKLMNRLKKMPTQSKGTSRTPHVDNSYIEPLINEINVWVDSLPIDLKSSNQKDVMVRELATEIADRQKYLEENPSKKLNNEEENNYLEYQVHRWLYKVPTDFEDPNEVIEMLRRHIDNFIERMTIFKAEQGWSSRIPVLYIQEVQQAISNWLSNIPPDLGLVLDERRKENLSRDLAEAISNFQKQCGGSKHLDSVIDDWAKVIFTTPKQSKHIRCIVGPLKEIIGKIPYRIDKPDTHGTDTFAKHLKIITKELEDLLEILPLDHNPTFELQKQQLIQELAVSLKSLHTKCKDLDNVDFLKNKVIEDVSEWLKKVPITAEKNTQQDRDYFASMVYPVIRDLDMASRERKQDSNSASSYAKSVSTPTKKTTRTSKDASYNSSPQNAPYGQTVRNINSGAFKTNNSNQPNTIDGMLNNTSFNTSGNYTYNTTQSNTPNSPNSFGKSHITDPGKQQPDSAKILSQEIAAWCNELPIPKGNTPEERKERESALLMLMFQLFQSISALAANPDTSQNRCLFQRLLTEQIIEMLNNLPKSPELESIKGPMAAKLVKKVMVNKECFLKPSSNMQALLMQSDNKACKVELYNYIIQWCHHLFAFMPEMSQSEINKQQSEMVLKILSKVFELADDPFILEDKMFLQDMISEQIEQLIDKLPRVPELQSQKHILALNLSGHIIQHIEVFLEKRRQQQYQNITDDRGEVHRHYKSVNSEGMKYFSGLEKGKSLQRAQPQPSGSGRRQSAGGAQASQGYQTFEGGVPASSSLIHQRTIADNQMGPGNVSQVQDQSMHSSLKSTVIPTFNDTRWSSDIQHTPPPTSPMSFANRSANGQEQIPQYPLVRSSRAQPSSFRRDQQQPPVHFTPLQNASIAPPINQSGSVRYSQQFAAERPRSTSEDKKLLSEEVMMWCNQLPIYQGCSQEEQQKKELLQVEILFEIFQKAHEIAADPDVFYDNIYFEELIEEEVERILNTLPMNPELQRSKRHLALELAKKIADHKNCFEKRDTTQASGGLDNTPGYQSFQRQVEGTSSPNRNATGYQTFQRQVEATSSPNRNAPGYQTFQRQVEATSSPTRNDFENSNRGTGTRMGWVLPDPRSLGVAGPEQHFTSLQSSNQARSQMGSARPQGPPILPQQYGQFSQDTEPHFTSLYSTKLPNISASGVQESRVPNYDTFADQVPATSSPQRQSVYQGPAISPLQNKQQTQDTEQHFTSLYSTNLPNISTSGVQESQAPNYDRFTDQVPATSSPQRQSIYQGRAFQPHATQPSMSPVCTRRHVEEASQAEVFSQSQQVGTDPGGPLAMTGYTSNEPNRQMAHVAHRGPCLLQQNQMDDMDHLSNSTDESQPQARWGARSLAPEAAGAEGVSHASDPSRTQQRSGFSGNTPPDGYSTPIDRMIPQGVMQRAPRRHRLEYDEGEAEMRRASEQGAPSEETAEVRCHCKERQVTKCQRKKKKGVCMQPSCSVCNNYEDVAMAQCPRCCGHHCPYPSFRYFR